MALVDDHIMVSELLALSITKEADMSLAGVVGTVHEALDLIQHVRPDVILLNYRLPDFECIEVVKLMLKESPDSHIVLLSGTGDDELQRLALEAGCSGLLGKNAQIGDVLAAIRAAVRGEPWIELEQPLARHYA
ncbi:MAG: response regulator [Acidimicrobiales bacterium]